MWQGKLSPPISQGGGRITSPGGAAELWGCGSEGGGQWGGGGHGDLSGLFPPQGVYDSVCSLLCTGSSEPEPAVRQGRCTSVSKEDHQGMGNFTVLGCFAFLHLTNLS